ncbi:hypothetical protein CANARDRAFT_59162 [[Candida] arabinofermentans NRRL YB-2248]|uniref:Uncharacterized protein n=1 Tax=[Candida] arabinofermentans NRRL YB-2248 TaxID=983967 RepID=A0A1E4T979_9ASCO|nr:hypothetical protein CANARDRAFT_59162 [[Candida] arabinofermentans NRRL YB-2248]
MIRAGLISLLLFHIQLATAITAKIYSNSSTTIGLPTKSSQHLSTYSYPFSYSSTSAHASTIPIIYGIQVDDSYFWQVEVPASLGSFSVNMSSTDEYSLDTSLYYPSGDWTESTDSLKFTNDSPDKYGISYVGFGFEPLQVNSPWYIGYATVITEDGTTYNIHSSQYYIEVGVRLIAYQDATTGDGVFELLLPSNFTPFAINGDAEDVDWEFDTDYYNIYKGSSLLESQGVDTLNTDAVSMSLSTTDSYGSDVYSVQFGMTPTSNIYVDHYYTATFTVSYASSSSSVLSTYILLEPTSQLVLYGFQNDTFAVWELDIPSKMSPFLVEGTGLNFNFNESHYYVDFDGDSIVGDDGAQGAGLDLQSNSMLFSYSGSSSGEIQVGAAVSQLVTDATHTYTALFTIYPNYYESTPPASIDTNAYSYSAVFVYTPHLIDAVLSGSSETTETAADGVSSSTAASPSPGVTSTVASSSAFAQGSPSIQIDIPANVQTIIGMQLEAVGGNIEYNSDAAVLYLENSAGSLTDVNDVQPGAMTVIGGSNLEASAAIEAEWFDDYSAYVFSVVGSTNTVDDAFSATFSVTYTYDYDLISSVYYATKDGTVLSAALSTSTNEKLRKRANGVQLRTTSATALSTTFHHSTVTTDGDDSPTTAKDTATTAKATTTPTTKDTTTSPTTKDTTTSPTTKAKTTPTTKATTTPTTKATEDTTSSDDEDTTTPSEDKTTSSSSKTTNTPTTAQNAKTTNSADSTTSSSDSDSEDSSSSETNSSSDAKGTDSSNDSSNDSSSSSTSTGSSDDTSSTSASDSSDDTSSASASDSSDSSSSTDEPTWSVSYDGTHCYVKITVPEAILSRGSIKNTAEEPENFEFEEIDGVAESSIDDESALGSLAQSSSEGSYVIVGEPLDYYKEAKFDVELSLDSNSKKLIKRQDSWSLSVTIPPLSTSTSTGDSSTDGNSLYTSYYESETLTSTNSNGDLETYVSSSLITGIPVASYSDYVVKTTNSNGKVSSYTTSKPVVLTIASAYSASVVVTTNSNGDVSSYTTIVPVSYTLSTFSTASGSSHSSSSGSGSGSGTTGSVSALEGVAAKFGPTAFVGGFVAAFLCLII